MIYFILLLMVELSLLIATFLCFAKCAWLAGILCAVLWSTTKYITNKYGQRIAGDGL